jgi:hypothetical protein
MRFDVLMVVNMLIMFPRLQFHAVLWMITSDSEEHIVSIFWVKMEGM